MGYSARQAVILAFELLVHLTYALSRARRRIGGNYLYVGYGIRDRSDSVYGETD